jgi:hypothetical protein
MLYGLHENKFSGFLIQARSIGPNLIVGSWIVDNDANEFIGALKCSKENVNVFITDTS